MTQLTPEKIINDGSECYATIAFFDQNNNPYIPTSLSYRVDDLTNGLNVVPATSVAPAQSVSVSITATQNTMNVLSNFREKRQVLWTVGIPGGTLRNDDITYAIVRKAGTP